MIINIQKLRANAWAELKRRNPELKILQEVLRYVPSLANSASAEIMSRGVVVREVLVEIIRKSSSFRMVASQMILEYEDTTYDELADIMMNVSQLSNEAWQRMESLSPDNDKILTIADESYDAVDAMWGYMTSHSLTNRELCHIMHESELMRDNAARLILDQDPSIEDLNEILSFETAHNDEAMRMLESLYSQEKSNVVTLE